MDVDLPKEMDWKEVVSETLSQVQTMIEDWPTTDDNLDTAEYFLNSVARMYRSAGKPNRSVKYRRVSSMVAHARMTWNSRNLHVALPEIDG